MKKAEIGDRVEFTQLSGRVIRGTVVALVRSAFDLSEPKPKLRKVPTAASVYWDKDCLSPTMKKRRKELGPDLGIAVPVRDLREILRNR